MWYYYLAVSLFSLWWILLRQRGGGKGSPPMVSTSTVFPFPFFGVISEFLKSPNTMMKRCLKDYGSVFTIPIFNQRMTFLIGPEAQSLFFQASDDVLSQDECYDFMTAVFGPNVVFDAPKKKRQVQFQTMANGLRTNRMKTYVEKIQDETKKYMEAHWNQKTGTIDLYKALSELTILTASRCLHGDDVREHMFAELHSLYHDLDHGLTPLTVLWKHAPTPAHLRRDKARKELVKLFGKIIQERRENPGKSDGKDILSLFMDMKYKDGTETNTEEVTGLLISLLFAGQHTSCVTSTWTLLYLLHNETCMNKVMSEQKEVGAVKKEQLEFDDINEMGYLHNCMREALRLCPTFIMLLRKCLKDTSVTVKGTTYQIPKGDLVVVSPTVSMRLESTFKNANEFEPERYEAPREEHKIPYSFMGFGGGMHACMGQNFAYLQVKTILSVILKQYTFKPEADHLPQIYYDDMVVGPKGNCNVIYEKIAA